jgi:hypothetical protein
MSEDATPFRPRCIHICCKSMLVFGEDFESDPDYQAGMVEFWCLRTSKGEGPDGDTVALEPCSNPERSCYQEY